MANPEQYLWWDNSHPTAAAHEILAQYSFSQIAMTIPEPGFTTLIGLAGLGLLVGRWKAGAKMR
ncbi:MAG: hypothetical protein ACFCU3_01320 [Verrucomicrobiales bacterium]